MLLLKNKIVNISNRLRNICSRDWELSPKILKRIYIRGIEHILHNAAEAWWPSVRAGVLRWTLTQMQWPVLLAPARGYWIAPTATLQVLAGIRQLEYKLDTEKDMHVIQHNTNIEIDGQNFSRKIWRR